MHEHDSQFRKTICRAITFALVAQCLSLCASQIPENNRPADVQTLRLSKIGGSDIRALCTDGFSPFGMARNNSATFMNSASLTLTTGTLCDFTDLGALATANSYFYLISDGKAPPRILSTSVREAQVGDTIVLRGLGLSGATVYTVDGEVIPSTLQAASTAADITFTVPDKVITSGNFQVFTPWGVSYSGLVNLISKIPLVTPNEIYDLAFYQDAGNTTRRLLLSVKENTTYRILSFNPANEAVTPFSTTASPAMGLSVGDLAGVQYLFYGRGATPSAVNSKIYKLDYLGGGVETDFRSISLSGDAMAVRATSFFPRIAALTDPRMVYAFDPQTTQQRIRQAPADTLVAVTTWANSVTWNADSATRNFPAGLAVRHPTSDYSDTPRTTFYTTTGAASGVNGAQSRLQFSYKTGANSSVVLWNSPAPVPATPLIPAIVNAAQIASEPFGGEHIYVADRGNSAFSYPARIHKVNAGHCGATEGGVGPYNCITTPALGFVSSFEYDRVLIDPHGIAIETGKDVANGDYSKFLWVTNKPAILAGNNGVTRLRALREIPIKLFIGRHAGNDLIDYSTTGGANYLNAGPKITTAFIRDYIIGTVIPAADLTLYKIGYKIKFDSTTDLVMDFDDSNLNFNDYSFRITGAGESCPTEVSDANGLTGHITADTKRVNIVIVHAIRLHNTALPIPDPNTLAYDTANGLYKRYSGSCGGFSNMVMSNYVASSGTAANSNAIMSPNVFAHELYHKLTAPYLQGAGGANGFDITGHRPLTANPNVCMDVVPQGRCPNNHLMCPCDGMPFQNLQVSGATANDRDDDLANIFGQSALEFVLPDNGAP